MNNLAQKHENSQGEVIEFPKQERQAMSDKDEGFTPLPNFICDEGYLAAISGDTFKCLYFLNRYIKGFHLENKSMSEALLKKITGIKDNRTIRKCTAELENFGLIKIEKSNGKSHSYSLTYSERLPINPVASNAPSTSNAVTCHATTPVASNVPATSDMACHPDKEIYLNKNLKKTHTENTCEKIEICEQWNPNIDHLKTIILQSSFSNRATEILAMSDFNLHLGNFNSHWENKTPLTENQKHRKFAMWLLQEFEKAERKKSFPEKQNTSRDVNQKWGEVQEYAPATGTVDLEGLI